MRFNLIETCPRYNVDIDACIGGWITRGTWYAIVVMLRRNMLEIFLMHRPLRVTRQCIFVAMVNGICTMHLQWF